MAVRIFNLVSVTAICGIILLFTTLWNLQSRTGYLDLLRLSNETGVNDKTSIDIDIEDGVEANLNATIEEAQLKSRPSFTEIGRKYGTDKVTNHHYNYMYEKYLEPMRDKPLKMLEIGLGCDMDYGPGASYHTWLEFFPNVDMYYIEYDAKCVEKWAVNVTNAKIFTGDQGDPAFLHSFVAQSGGGFDIIVDDGGHHMEQQIHSLNILFDIVLPGGIYFCEDLGTSYDIAHGGNTPGRKSMMQMIAELLNDLNTNIWLGPTQINEVASQMRSLECGEEICAFFKKELER
ncbi:hypothetical protein G7Y89_g10111 [Cudoniella acicularis]|uniref:Hard-surface induced protein 5 n=1 Tax=Cudoniella acicularis TaxID=354080 RepID=A0A8H4RG45_9HELO|nr:hypothetical protein G7Y89_g10111 [Cudoniella acicularis]